MLFTVPSLNRKLHARISEPNHNFIGIPVTSARKLYGGCFDLAGIAMLRKY